MNYDIDKITSYGYKSLDILFLRRPERTAYGFLLGSVFCGCSVAISNVLNEKWSVFFSSIKWYVYIFTGILITRVDVLFYKEPLDEKVLKQMNTFKRVIDESNLTEPEKRTQYRRLLERIIENVDNENISENYRTE